MKMKVKLDPGAKMPTRAHDDDAGLDLYSPDDFIIYHGDSGYTGSIRVKLFNHGHCAVSIEKGQKIAQLVIKSIITPKLLVVDKLDETDRGDGGFGSTGKF